MSIALRQYALHTDRTKGHHLGFWDALEQKLTPEQRALYAEGGELREGLWLEPEDAPLKPSDAVRTEISEWKAKVRALKLSQPDALTCQATCIAMAAGDPDIRDVRQRLLKIGTAGDPAVMGQVIRQYSNLTYEYSGNASLDEVYKWLQAGELLITHGWFTASGHVIVLDGLMRDPRSGKYLINVADPWSEFYAPTWKYPAGGVKFYDGFYSEECIYAACVAGQSVSDAKATYRLGKLNRGLKAMWVHRIRVRG